MFKTTHILITAGLTACLSHHCFAYDLDGSWDHNEITLRFSSTSFPSGSAFRDSVEVVRDRFYNNPSNCSIEHEFGSVEAVIDETNGENEVWASTNDDFSPALTLVWTRGDEIVEADIIFYAAEESADDWEWTTSMNKGSITSYVSDATDDNTERPFETTCLHEYGHVAGLDHEPHEYNIMGQDWTHVYCNGSTCRSGMGEDAADGLVALYGRASGGAFEDVAVTLFKYSGMTESNGDWYSTHVFSGMYWSGGAAMSSFDTYNYQNRYTVAKGSTYQVEFTYENNGETTQTPKLAFYISTDSTIATSDTRIKTGSVSLGRNDVHTAKVSVTIPSTLTSGNTYYLGVIIDYNNAITEVDGSNNAAYHIVKIN